MACYYPLQGYRSKAVEPSGKRRIVFNPRHGIQDQQVDIPCGQCIGCRLERSKQWAIRCVHEASIHEENCFITLTYADEHLPENGDLVKKHFQDFMKRFRKAHGKMRYYYCGEYGSQYDDQGNKITDSLGRELLGRPHYHACIFGFDFDDKVLWQIRRGISLYRSEKLERLWQYGYSSVGAVTFESAAYVARYVTKKINGQKADDICDQGLKHYEKLTDDGEIVEVQKEYTDMSRRPGIGRDWFMHYKDDVYEHDSVIIRGKELKPPRYYMQLYEGIDEVGHDLVKENRREKMLKHQADNTIDRLRQREKVKLAQTKTLKRELQ